MQILSRLIHNWYTFAVFIFYALRLLAAVISKVKETPNVDN